MFTSRDPDSQDGYIRPVYPFINKVKRLSWQICWLISCRWTPVPMHAWRIAVIRLWGGKIGKSNFIYPSCSIWAPWLLETAEVVTIGPGVEIYNPGGVQLGHHSVLSQNCYLCGATHDYNSIEFTYKRMKIIIEPYVWICARAIVLPGVHCKQGCVLGAGSVTSKSLDAWSVYAGNPAKKSRDRVNFYQNK